MNSLHKILDLQTAVKVADRSRKSGVPVVFTNGCFDILHAGHVSLLERAAERGSLFVGINSDASVMQLKGQGRPINTASDRLKVIAALECVDVVFQFDDLNVAGCIRTLRPDCWVKGGDYTLDTLNKEEVEAANSAITTISILSHLDGYSTTSIINKCTN